MENLPYFWLCLALFKEPDLLRIYSCFRSKYILCKSNSEGFCKSQWEKLAEASENPACFTIKFSRIGLGIKNNYSRNFYHCRIREMRLSDMINAAALITININIPQREFWLYPCKVLQGCAHCVLSLPFLKANPHGMGAGCLTGKESHRRDGSSGWKHF